MSEYKCQCGHTGTDHPYIKLRRGYKTECTKCSCEKFIGASVLSQQGDTFTDIREQFRKVLREKYREYCFNCDKHLDIPDIDLGIVEPENEYRNLYTHRIVCQNCFTKNIELVVSAYRTVNVSFYISLLDDPTRFNAKVIVFDS